jgi:hypothetical protein
MQFLLKITFAGFLLRGIILRAVFPKKVFVFFCEKKQKPPLSSANQRTVILNLKLQLILSAYLLRGACVNV